VLHVERIDEMMAFYRDVLGFRLSDYFLRPYELYFLHINRRHHSIAFANTGRNAVHHMMMEMFSLDDVGQGYDIAMGEEGRLAALHPTIKPVAMVADAILDSSRRGDIVLDCFLGSGSTLMAAERTGRQCRGLELDPLYVDAIVRRWQAYTGAAARHAVTGATFDEAAGAAERAR